MNQVFVFFSLLFAVNFTLAGERACVRGICEGELVYYAPEKLQEKVFITRVSKIDGRVYLYQTEGAWGRVFSTPSTEVLITEGCGPWWHPTSWCVGTWAILKERGGLWVKIVAVNPESDWVLIDVPLIHDTELHYHKAQDLYLPPCYSHSSCSPFQHFWK